MAVPDLGFIELMRWAWRQLTSMRTALILLLLLALAAVPGSVIPQSDVDAMRANNWKADHPDLTPIYEKLGLFSVYDSVWFSAIYLLLMVSLVGCILPRLRVYWRGFRAAPPKAPRNLTRLPENASYTTDEPVEEVLARAEQVLRKRRFRVIADGDAISAERGYLREAGNLVFHASLLVVLAGVAMGSLMGYQGGVIVGKGASFSNNLTQYDDFKAGRMVGVDNLDPFTFTVDDFEVEWIDDPTNPRYGMARKFVAPLTYRDGSDGEEKTYDLRVNHPLKIGSTDVFLIGHGYSPVITIRDAEGNIATSGPTPFLPEDQATFTSFGVVKAPGAEPQQIGLEGLLYPTYSGDPNNLGSVFGALGNPLISMQAYVGDLGLAAGSQSVYVLNKTNMKLLGGTTKDLFRVDLCPAKIDGKENARCENSTVQLPDGAGSVTFEDITPWVRVQISQTPGKMVALGGMIAALLGLLGSLFIRPRRMWVRVRETDGSTVVEVAALDRSSGGEVGEEIVEVVAALKGETVKEEL
ncbi:cytochrome c biogenesis protein ResB [Nocardioides sp. Bht2]|uniref:cytochrome c biogenesis protein ResB n=1 Tax=Nocardioides sp. Bht2 TaxID=3392297 RepID=UPI0039B39B44